MKTLAAYTALEPQYPPYFNASEDGDEVVLIVRGSPTLRLAGAVVEGPTASIRVPRAAFDELLKGLAA